jgi:hypothetical protein
VMAGDGRGDIVRLGGGLAHEHSITPPGEALLEGM